MHVYRARVLGTWSCTRYVLGIYIRIRLFVVFYTCKMCGVSESVVSSLSSFVFLPIFALIFFHSLHEMKQQQPAGSGMSVKSYRCPMQHASRTTYRSGSWLAIVPSSLSPSGCCCCWCCSCRVWPVRQQQRHTRVQNPHSEALTHSQ